MMKLSKCLRGNNYNGQTFNILVAFYILQWQWTLDRMQQVVVGTLLRNFTVYFACQPG